MSRYMYLCLYAAICICALFGTAWAAEENKTVVDSRGIAVQVPAEINRVVTISDGLVEEVMTVMGVQNKLVGLGSAGFSWVSDVKAPLLDGGNESVGTCIHVASYLNPWIRNLTTVAVYGTPINFETLAGLHPDLVILRVGDCTYGRNDENTKKTIDSIESMKIPIIVLYGPPCYDEPNIETITKEIRILGVLFGKQEKADELVKYLVESDDIILERTRKINDTEKVRVMIFGMSPQARSKGGAGYTYGLNTMESYFLENIVNAKNAYQENGGSTQLLSSEQVLALDPDVIVLATSHKYPTPQELYVASYYQNLQEMRAIKNKRVAALPWTPVNCAKRLEYPIEIMVMAKAAYPELFSDVDLGQWILDFYEGVYGINDTQARNLRSLQGMNWTVEYWGEKMASG